MSASVSHQKSSSIPFGLRVALAGGVVFLAACTANTVINADLRGRGSVPASSDEVTACKNACSTAESQCTSQTAADCSSRCATSTSDQAVGFNDCVKNSACDPACADKLAAPDGASTDDGTATPTADASAPKADGGSTSPPPTADAGTVDPPTNDETGLSECMGACANSSYVKECAAQPSSAESDCMVSCQNAKGPHRLNFASCATTPTDCASFLSSCLAEIAP